MLVIDIHQDRKFADSRPITRQLIRADCVWNVIFAQQSLEERPCCVCVSVALEQHVKHGPVFVNRSPKSVGHPTHDHVHFIEMPPGTPAGFPVT